MPQFITSEDKIIGPLTIRQFIYVCIAGIFCFALYFTVKPWLFVLLTVVFMGTALALGMMQISGRPLTHVIKAAFGFYWNPQLYLWQPKQSNFERHKVSLETIAMGGGVGRNSEDAVAGGALRSAWQKLQTGNKMSSQQFFGKTEDRYQIYRKLAGDREAARRIDYR
ncbi:MAG: PrgI family protein [Patescibacteria group bacterium]